MSITDMPLERTWQEELVRARELSSRDGLIHALTALVLVNAERSARSQALQEYDRQRDQLEDARKAANDELIKVLANTVKDYFAKDERLRGGLVWERVSGVVGGGLFRSNPFRP